MSESKTLDRFLWTIAAILLGFLALTIVFSGLLITLSPLRGMVGNVVDGIFALSSVQSLWYITRAAGLVAYLLLWLSTAWGLAVTSKIFDPFLQRAFTYDAHQFLSLLAIGFTLLHIVVLLGDQYLPFSLVQILVPFVAPYRPIWVGLGILGMYLTLIVSVTFYIRQWIGARTFRLIHYASFLAYIGVTLHGLFAGTDSAVWVTKLMYAGTALVIVFLTVYWLAVLSIDKLTTNVIRDA
jgi:predicted ferric reductase